MMNTSAVNAAVFENSCGNLKGIEIDSRVSGSGSFSIGYELTGGSFCITVVSGGGSSLGVLKSHPSSKSIIGLKEYIPVALNPLFMFV